MRHLVLSVCLMLLAAPLAAFDIEDHAVFGPENASRQVRVLSVADVDVFSPVIESFRAAHPDITVDYTVAASTAIMTAISGEQAPFDVVISSAMDLQTKLANDGFTQSFRSTATLSLPDWARWRDDLFAFTQEPAAIVLSRAAFAGHPLPETRQALITVLRQNPDLFRDRVGTYDLRSSGLGYLFATQDARTSEVYWRLTEVMGALGTRLYCCSSDMIDDVASGELAIAYNVLASYALSRADLTKVAIVLPEDFSTVMLRTALIPRNAPAPVLAGRFIDFLLTSSWTDADVPQSPLSVSSAVFLTNRDRFRRIRLGPELLVYLDGYKRDRFLEAWKDAVLQE
ncbi:MAG: ABC transporter substrate-binding protein [Rhodobacteraceae bacterium]|nr:ABC transporter substrate-binding protein [Paracoccaceae bacterium]